MNMKSIKNTLRKTIRKKLRNIPENEINQQSKTLISKLQQQEYFQKSTNICLYLPLKFELNTTPLLYDCLNENKKVFIPVVRKDSLNDMDMFRVYSKDDFEKFEPQGKYKILEPPTKDIDQREKLVDEYNNNMDMNKKKEILIIVPGMAFDKSGNRLGRGKGYYDKYLSKIYELNQPNKNKNIFNITLCSMFLSVQLIESVPVEKHDKIIKNLIY